MQKIAIPPGDMPAKYADVSDLEKDLGYRPHLNVPSEVPDATL
ncbi:MAG: hypothetical protein ACK4KT_01620 [Thermaurantimonas sp.]